MSEVIFGCHKGKEVAIGIELVGNSEYPTVHRTAPHLQQ